MTGLVRNLVGLEAFKVLFASEGLIAFCAPDSISVMKVFFVCVFPSGFRLEPLADFCCQVSIFETCSSSFNIGLDIIIYYISKVRQCISANKTNSSSYHNIFMHV